MKRLGEQFWFYYFIISFGLTFIFFFPVQWILLQRKSFYPAAKRYRSAWARVILFVWGVRPVIHNRQWLKVQGPVILCSNHSSYLDILTCLVLFKKETVFLGKAQLLDIPLFGKYFRTLDIAVDREDGIKSAKSYRLAVKALELQQNLVIFPEGGIMPNPLKIKPFKEGAFQIAIRHHTPILPVGFPDNYKIIPDRPRAAKPGKIRIILHEPLQTAGLTLSDMDALKKTLADILQRDITS